MVKEAPSVRRAFPLGLRYDSFVTVLMQAVQMPMESLWKTHGKACGRSVEKSLDRPAGGQLNAECCALARRGANMKVALMADEDMLNDRQA